MTLKPEHIVEELNRTPKLKRDLIINMWVYDSPIGPLYIVRTDDGQYGFLYDGIIWEACPTPQIEADNVYCRATGCAAASNLKELPHDLSEWTHVSR